MKCPTCAGALEFSGFVSLPPKSIFKCGPCGKSIWLDGPPSQHRPQKYESQPQQQSQAKLVPEE